MFSSINPPALRRLLKTVQIGWRTFVGEKLLRVPRQRSRTWEPADSCDFGSPRPIPQSRCCSATVPVTDLDLLIFAVLLQISSVQWGSIE